MRLKERREAHGMSQAALAKAVKTSQVNIWNYENGRYRPKYDIASRLAELFGCSVQDIMDGCTPEGGKG